MHRRAGSAAPPRLRGLQCLGHLGQVPLQVSQVDEHAGHNVAHRLYGRIGGRSRTSQRHRLHPGNLHRQRPQLALGAGAGKGLGAGRRTDGPVSYVQHSASLAWMSRMSCLKKVSARLRNAAASRQTKAKCAWAVGDCLDATTAERSAETGVWKAGDHRLSSRSSTRESRDAGDRLSAMRGDGSIDLWGRLDGLVARDRCRERRRWADGHP